MCEPIRVVVFFIFVVLQQEQSGLMRSWRGGRRQKIPQSNLTSFHATYPLLNTSYIQQSVMLIPH